MDHGSRRAIIAAFFANLGIALSKFAAFAVTGAASMLAEAIHSVADTGNQGLLLLGGVKARRPADEVHNFGYGTLRYFWAFVVALVLFSVGGLFAIYEGIEKLRHPHEIDDPRIAIGVLIVAIVLEVVLAADRACGRAAPSAGASRSSSSSAARRSRSWRSSCWRTSARSSVCASRWRA